MLTVMLSERLLQFIWQFQYFNQNELTTAGDENLQIIYNGSYNKNQGPDFSEAKIKIDTTVLIGNIELHINASDWYKHHHEKDENYAGIILHVVWNNDEVVYDKLLKALPTLELKPRVSKLLIEKYSSLMESQLFIPCEKNLPLASSIIWLSWKERLIVERLQRRSKVILQLLLQSNNSWEELFWWLLAKNFGANVNSTFFEELARSIKVNILSKHKNQIHQLEALLFGQGGLLQNNFEEEYPKMLQREYKFLAKKYKLVQLNSKPAFLRMRPANFPTIRLAQLAMLINNASHLFSKIKELQNVNEVRKLFDVTANDYWHYHYRFDEKSLNRPKTLGLQMIDNIFINTVCPVLFCYGMHTNEQKWKDKAIYFFAGIKS